VNFFTIFCPAEDRISPNRARSKFPAGIGSVLNLVVMNGNAPCLDFSGRCGNANGNSGPPWTTTIGAPTPTWSLTMNYDITVNSKSQGKRI